MYIFLRRREEFLHCSPRYEEETMLKKFGYHKIESEKILTVTISFKLAS
jgi:hypothetical protein